MLALRKPQTIETEKTTLGDVRFRALMSQEAWDRLPGAVRRRFSKRLSGGETAVYSGFVREVRISTAGRFLAQMLRLIGAPLPIFTDSGVPTVVTVSEDVRTGGQIWTRLYANRSGFPQVIHSAKRFSGPTGLEEYIGFGISMALSIRAEPSGIVFQSAGYSIGLGRFRMNLPRWLSPGQLTVRHLATEADRFHFEMTLSHPTFGELVHQVADYSDGGSW
jgi:hypothetical protein